MEVKVGFKKLIINEKTMTNKATNRIKDAIGHFIDSKENYVANTRNP